MKYTVVLIEDEHAHSLLYEFNLTQRGFEVISFSSKDSIMSGLHSLNRIDLLIVSIELDENSGIDLCKNILIVFPSLPILLLSTSPCPPLCERPSCLSTLSKPFSLNELFLKVVEITGQRNQIEN